MTRKQRVVVPVAVIALALATWRLGFSRGDVPAELTASGTVEATEAQLGFQASGRIEQVAVREGEPVRAGAELARLDQAEPTARRSQALAQRGAARAQLQELEYGSRPEEIAQARAAVDAARERTGDAARDLERTTRLFEGGAASREQLEKATTARAVAASQLQQAEEQLRLVRAGPRRERVAAQRAQLALAEATLQGTDASLANTLMRAPFAGVVTLRHREPGEIVPAGAPVLTIMNPDDRWVRVYVPENRLAAVRLGARATITSDTYRGKHYAGEVAYVAPEAEFTPKSVQTSEERVKLVYAVKVRITGDAARDLKPGMPADVRLATPEAP